MLQVPGCTELSLQFDARTSIPTGQKLHIYADPECKEEIVTLSGKGYSNFAPITLKTNQFWYTISGSSRNGDTQWGYRFTCSPVCVRALDMSLWVLWFLGVETLSERDATRVLTRVCELWGSVKLACVFRVSLTRLVAHLLRVVPVMHNTTTRAHDTTNTNGTDALCSSSSVDEHEGNHGDSGDSVHENTRIVVQNTLSLAKSEIAWRVSKNGAREGVNAGEGKQFSVYTQTLVELVAACTEWLRNYDACTTLDTTLNLDDSADMCTATGIPTRGNATASSEHLARRVGLSDLAEADVSHVSEANMSGVCGDSTILEADATRRESASSDIVGIPNTSDMTCSDILEASSMRRDSGVSASAGRGSLSNMAVMPNISDVLDAISARRDSGVSASGCRSSLGTGDADMSSGYNFIREHSTDLYTCTTEEMLDLVQYIENSCAKSLDESSKTCGSRGRVGADKTHTAAGGAGGGGLDALLSTYGDFHVSLPVDKTPTLAESESGICDDVSRFVALSGQLRRARCGGGKRQRLSDQDVCECWLRAQNESQVRESLQHPYRYDVCAAVCVCTGDVCVCVCVLCMCVCVCGG
jgi:hypothetical protein